MKGRTIAGAGVTLAGAFVGALMATNFSGQPTEGQSLRGWASLAAGVGVGYRVGGLPALGVAAGVAGAWRAYVEWDRATAPPSEGFQPAGGA